MTMPNEMQLQVYVKRDLVDRLQREADRRVVGRRRLVEAAIAAWLDAHEGDPIPGVSST